MTGSLHAHGSCSRQPTYDQDGGAIDSRSGADGGHAGDMCRTRCIIVDTNANRQPASTDRIGRSWRGHCSGECKDQWLVPEGDACHRSTRTLYGIPSVSNR